MTFFCNHNEFNQDVPQLVSSLLSGYQPVSSDVMVGTLCLINEQALQGDYIYKWQVFIAHQSHQRKHTFCDQMQRCASV